MERVRSSDVLDVTHHTVRAIRGRVIGYFRRLGPNSWDDYGFVAEEGEELELLPLVPVMLERRGLELRVRSKGRVVKLVVVLGEAERSELSPEASKADLRRFLVERLLSPQGQESTLGASGVIAKKLGD